MPGRRSPNWNDEMLGRMADDGRIVRADTIDAVALAIGADPVTLRATVDRYNTLVERGDDVDHHKGSGFLRPIATGPFYAAEVRLATVALTAVGLRIERNAEVLDHAGRVIPGLFAAGECTGGVLGDVYMGSGNSYSNCLVFGRIAGASAARRASEA
jgi:fumarate reductase flavoprotein subunit